MSKQDFEEVKSKVEAILFSYGDWISPKDIMSSLSLDSELLVKNSLKELETKYKEGYPFSVQTDDNSKWRMALKPEYEELVSDLITNVEIPQKVLKVLSIIAYEQPVTKTRLAEILGRSVKQEISYLYRNKFLSYEKRGIGKYYRVTKKFYDYFKIEQDQEDFRDIANKNISEYIEEFSHEAKENSTENTSEQQ
jgi:segregation and condensation protein B